MILAPLALAAALVAGAQAGGMDDPYDAGWDDEPAPARVLLSAWTGQGLAEGGAGRGSSFFAASADWAFAHVDLGLQGAAYRDLGGAARTWTPAVLARLTQRFRTARGFEAAFGFGVGTARLAGWTGWYQVALGVRVPLGPLFLGGELSFERDDLLRLGAGLGVAF